MPRFSSVTGPQPASCEVVSDPLGVRAAARRRDLSAIGGQWTAQEATAFEHATAVFETVDEEVWR